MLQITSFLASKTHTKLILYAFRLSLKAIKIISFNERKEKLSVAIFDISNHFFRDVVLRLPPFYRKIK